MQQLTIKFNLTCFELWRVCLASTDGQGPIASGLQQHLAGSMHGTVHLINRDSSQICFDKCSAENVCFNQPCLSLRGSCNWHQPELDCTALISGILQNKA